MLPCLLTEGYRRVDHPMITFKSEDRTSKLGSLYLDLHNEQTQGTSSRSNPGGFIVHIQGPRCKVHHWDPDLVSQRTCMIGTALSNSISTGELSTYVVTNRCTMLPAVQYPSGCLTVSVFSQPNSHLPHLSGFCESSCCLKRNSTASRVGKFCMC